MKQLIALFAASLLSVAAIAQDKPSKSEPAMKSAQATFESLDKNADQQISKTEAAADKALASAFTALDTNGDGYVSKSEYAARTKS
jgi:Ca2+-binding EF-hand superfamily protein